MKITKVLAERVWISSSSTQTDAEFEGEKESEDDKEYEKNEASSKVG